MGINWKKIFHLGGEEGEKIEEKAKARAYNDAEIRASIKALAYEMVVKRIAKAFSKCEFRTFEKGEEVKGLLYYRLNISPNANKNATQFWEAVIHSMYGYGMHALIVPRQDGCLYLADDFVVDDKNAFFDHKFTGVRINDFTYPSALFASNVIYLKLNDERVKNLLDDSLGLQDKLLSISQTAYKRSNGQKYKVHVDQIHSEDSEKLGEIINEDFKTLFENDNVALPEYDGYLYERLDTGSGTPLTTRDIKAIVDDEIELTAKAMLMPTNIMTGEVTDTSKAVDDFLTFCLDSIVELIQDELNRKMFSPQEYLNGTFIKINTNTIKHIDILDVATAIEKLLGSGVETINDIRRILGQPEISEEWADTHFMTKNFADINELLDAVSNPSLTEPDNDVGEDGRKEET